MTTFEPFSELDLLAYADGLLDHDPGRKARVEAYLRGAPEAAERVAAYRAQTLALRESYGARAMEPVPDRLHDALRPSAARSRLHVSGLRAAAMVVVSAAAGAAGWHLAQVSAPTQQAAEQRLPSVLREVVRDEREGLRTLPVTAGDAAPERMLRWRVNGVGLSLKTPDLSSVGYKLRGRQDLPYAGTQAVALSYAGANGARLRLLIAPVAPGEARVVSLSEHGDARFAHWSQGALIMAVQSENASRDLAALGRDIRDTIARELPAHRHDQTPPDFPIPPGKVEVTADAMSPQTADGVESTADPGAIGIDRVIE
jgi:anti-sigma factor RsiW